METDEGSALDRLKELLGDEADSDPAAAAAVSRAAAVSGAISGAISGGGPEGREERAGGVAAASAVARPFRLGSAGALALWVGLGFQAEGFQAEGLQVLGTKVVDRKGAQPALGGAQEIVAAHRALDHGVSLDGHNGRPAARADHAPPPKVDHLLERSVRIGMPVGRLAPFARTRPSKSLHGRRGLQDGGRELRLGVAARACLVEARSPKGREGRHPGPGKKVPAAGQPPPRLAPATGLAAL
mmetsp:Transcript_50720/g.115203  ORF Transcript_50720/g.115203 Transcript_50720/m.115203 type:complete len:242 (-) Transcript_50720:82-807(-)